MPTSKFALMAFSACSLLLGGPVFADDAASAAGGAAPAAPPTAPAMVAEPGVEITRAVLCHDVKDREPQDELTSANVGEVVVGWTQVQTGGPGETSIKHRWSLDGQLLADIELPIKGSPWRTWSRKTIGEPGSWEWQVVDSKGTVLKDVKFTASVASTAPAAPAAESAPANAPAAAPAAPAAHP